MEELQFLTFDYYLDKSDPDVVILRRQDGSFVAAFSARGATNEGILEAAKEDRRKLIQAHTDPLLGQEMVGFVYDTESRENQIEAPTKEGWSAHTDSEGAHSVAGRYVGTRRRWRGIRSDHLPGTLRRHPWERPPG
jgi:hypothetical protein